MQQNYKKESFIKGEQFEKYVEEVIFPDAHYELIYKTSDSKQNTTRYPRKSMEPDFQFKCRVSGKEFYVEAKWRAKPYKDNYDVLSDKQLKSFPGIHSDVTPIFIVFGYGGQAFDPDYVSLIPFKNIDSSKLSPSIIHTYNIEKSYYPNSNFATNEDSSEIKLELHNPSNKENKIVAKSNYKVLGLAAVGLVAILLSIYSFAFSDQTEVISPKEKLENLVAEYYQSMNSNQIEKLPKFLSPKIESWYGDKNPTQEEVIRNAKEHRGKYPFSSSNIDWDTFKVIHQEDDSYHVSYEMIYRSKKNISDDYTVYDLKLITKWDEDYKLRSITEVRN